MPVARITKTLVEAMQSGDVWFDDTVRGFMVRHRGRGAHYAVKVPIKGKRVPLQIGRHGPGAWTADRARREAERLIGLARDKKDPREEKAAEKAAPDFAEFSARYMTEYAEVQKKPRTRAEDARLLKLHLLPRFQDMKVRDISKGDIQKFHIAMRDTPVSANRALALLSALLGWAERVDVRPDNSNPCRHIDKFPEKARERLLTAPELARLGDALNRAAEPWTEESKAAWRVECERQANEGDIPESQRAAWVAARMPRRESAEDWRALAAYKLLIFTGARLGEILNLQWGWIDAAQGVARLPDSKTGAKNLYLPPGALAVLEGLPRFAVNPHVIPGDKAGSAFVGIQKPWQRVRALAGLPDVHLHDLRHAFASTAVAAGDSLFIVGKLLGHRQSSTTERYSHLAPDPARAVADRTGERLRQLMTSVAGAPQ